MTICRIEPKIEQSNKIPAYTQFIFALFLLLSIYFWFTVISAIPFYLKRFLGYDLRRSFHKKKFCTIWFGGKRSEPDYSIYACICVSAKLKCCTYVVSVICNFMLLKVNPFPQNHGCWNSNQTGYLLISPLECLS